MPIWGQVELLCRAIAEEGQKEADRIISEAQMEAKRVVAEVKEREEKAVPGGGSSPKGRRPRPRPDGWWMRLNWRLKDGL